MDIKALHKRYLSCSKVSTDTRRIDNNDIFFALKGENFNGNTFAEKAIELGAKYVVIDEEEYEIKSKTILVKDVLTSLQDLARHHRKYLDIKIIGLTGSNGKTTTKELINAVLSQKYSVTATKGNLNNHIGVPLTLLSMTKDTEIGIVEMGANHKKEIEFLSGIAKPDYGYITNFGKAHLEGFGSIQGVIAGKSELYLHLIENNKYIFFNADDSIQNEKLSHYIKKFGFSKSNNQYYNIDIISAHPFVSLKVEDIEIKSNLIGTYNFSNMCAAILMGKYFNVDLESIKKGIESYTPENNRSQIIEKQSNKIILDAYNANPTSMAAALHNFSELKDATKIAILGDMFELGDTTHEEHQAIVDLSLKLKIDRIFLIGKHFYKTQNNSEIISLHESFDDLKHHFKSPENSTLLIKGSRGMALERILELL